MQKKLVLSLSLSSIIVWAIAISILFVQGETYQVISHSEKEQYQQMTKAPMDSDAFLQAEKKDSADTAKTTNSKQPTKMSIKEVGLTKEWVTQHSKNQVLSINKLLATLEIDPKNPLSSN